MYKGRRGWGENILCGWESGKEVGSTPALFFNLVLINIELWPLFYGGYLTLQKNI
jgi:hypothetical protein